MAVHKPVAPPTASPKLHALGPTGFRTTLPSLPTPSAPTRVNPHPCIVNPRRSSTLLGLLGSCAYEQAIMASAQRLISRGVFGTFRCANGWGLLGPAGKARAFRQGMRAFEQHGGAVTEVHVPLVSRSTPWKLFMSRSTGELPHDQQPAFFDGTRATRSRRISLCACRNIYPH